MPDAPPRRDRGDGGGGAGAHVIAERRPGCGADSRYGAEGRSRESPRKIGTLGSPAQSVLAGTPGGHPDSRLSPYFGNGDSESISDALRHSQQDGMLQHHGLDADDIEGMKSGFLHTWSVTPWTSACTNSRQLFRK